MLFSILFYDKFLYSKFVTKKKQIENNKMSFERGVNLIECSEFKYNFFLLN